MRFARVISRQSIEAQAPLTMSMMCITQKQAIYSVSQIVMRIFCRRQQVDFFRNIFSLIEFVAATIHTVLHFKRPVIH
jgi:hypothetical protein